LFIVRITNGEPSSSFVRSVLYNTKQTKKVGSMYSLLGTINTKMVYVVVTKDKPNYLFFTTKITGQTDLLL
jgi:hypothetical protein